MRERLEQLRSRTCTNEAPLFWCVVGKAGGECRNCGKRGLVRNFTILFYLNRKFLRTRTRPYEKKEKFYELVRLEFRYLKRDFTKCN